VKSIMLWITTRENAPLAATRFQHYGTDHDSEPLLSFRGFVYQHAHFGADKKSIEIGVRPRKGSGAVCSRCHLPAPGYDQFAERRFESFPCADFSSSFYTPCGALTVAAAAVWLPKKFPAATANAH
jgi:hypothetical protein